MDIRPVVEALAIPSYTFLSTEEFKGAKKDVRHPYFLAALYVSKKQGKDMSRIRFVAYRRAGQFAVIARIMLCGITCSHGGAFLLVLCVVTTGMRNLTAQASALEERAAELESQRAKTPLDWTEVQQAELDGIIEESAKAKKRATGQISEAGTLTGCGGDD